MYQYIPPFAIHVLYDDVQSVLYDDDFKCGDSDYRCCGGVCEKFDNI